MTKQSARDEPEVDARRAELLDAALSVFLRFGFRKASMDEVARAAHISRQGLYLRFETKEDLFKATVQHFLEGGMRRANAHLRDAALGVEEQLVRAFDEIVGCHIGTMQADAADLGEASQALVGDMIAEFDAAFIKSIAKTLGASGVSSAYKPLALSAQKLAETLHATARGLKYMVKTRAEFKERMAVAVRAMCFPLRVNS